MVRVLHAQISKFNSEKAAAAALLFLEKEGGMINVLKLIKLMYLLDRVSFERRNTPVVGGWYVSMKHGPVTSEVLDVVNGSDDSIWSRCISGREDHMVGKAQDLDKNPLSESEENLINELYSIHGKKSQYELRDWCHENCPEWHKIDTGMEPIPPHRYLEAVGKTDSEKSRILEELNELDCLESLLS